MSREARVCIHAGHAALSSVSAVASARKNNVHGSTGCPFRSEYPSIQERDACSYPRSSLCTPSVHAMIYEYPLLRGAMFPSRVVASAHPILIPARPILSHAAKSNRLDASALTAHTLPWPETLER